MPSINKGQTEQYQQSDVVPELNAKALQTLTQKIQDNLKKSNNTPPKHNKTEPKKEKASEKQAIHNEPWRKSGKQIDVGTEQRNTKAPLAKAAASKKPEPVKGKKRLRDGQVKDRKESKIERSNANSTKLGSRSAKKPTTDTGDLEDDVFALGGTKEDLDLLGDAGSDSEVDGDAGVDGKIAAISFKGELLRMVEGLGIDKADTREVEDLKTDDEEEEEEMDAGVEDRKVIVETGKVSANGVQAFPKGGAIDIEPPRQDSKSKGRRKGQLIFRPQSEWHAAELPSMPVPSHKPRAIPLDLSDRIHEHAKERLGKENAEYAAHHGSASTEHKFYSTLMSTGTLSDKVSALTLSVQESPLHNMKALESLVGLASKRSRDQAVNVLGALKDLFGPGNLLPSDRRLRSFASQPALAAAFGSGTFHSWTSTSPLPKSLQEAHLIYFAYEDWLKSRFFEVLKILESWCNDEVAYARGRAVDYVFSLLKAKPEQEANLLRLLVNKLGDADKKIASKTSYNILQLQISHPLMKPTIIAAIESDLLFRSGQSLHTKYYAVITLNQTVLSTKEEGVARKLLDIYFNLFANLLQKPEPAKTDVAPTSVNKVTINKKGEIQGGGGSAGKKAVKKQMAAEKSTAVEEDLREKMLSAVLTGVNRAIPYTTTDDEYFEKHLDTLYRVTHSSNFNTGIQALMLIQQLNGVNKGSQDRFYRVLYESLLDQRLMTSSKQALYLNLLFRALRMDLNVNRVKAFVKRLFQVIAMHQPPFVCGVLYLLRELEKVFPALASLVDEAEDNLSDDEEESFHDVRDVADASPMDFDAFTSLPSKVSPKHAKYDPRKRDPVHADASTTPVWELPILTQHYHPSVSLFATRLLGHDPMPPKPDLQQNTLISFLDRFVYKNPKTSSTIRPKGASIMQPLGSGVDEGSILVSAYSGASSRAQPVNSDVFWRQRDENVGADEVFFHKYFGAVKSEAEKKRERKEKKAKKSKKGGEDDESGDDEEEEEEIWKALVDSKPDIEGDNGSDVDFSDDDEEMLAALSDDQDSEIAALQGGDDGEGGEMEAEGALLDLDNGDSDIDMGIDDEADLDVVSGREDPQSNGERMSAAGVGEEKGDRKAKRKRMKSLPTFADADEYAAMLAEGSDGEGR